MIEEENLPIDEVKITCCLVAFHLKMKDGSESDNKTIYKYPNDVTPIIPRIGENINFGEGLAVFNVLAVHHTFMPTIQQGEAAPVAAIKHAILISLVEQPNS
jgi:hypothetical protein